VPPLVLSWLGRIDYGTAAALQDRLVLDRRRGVEPDRLLLLEHDPVVTLGRRADRAHVLRREDDLARVGIVVRPSSRGGDVTFHGPGQLVGYPIVALPPERRDVHRYLRDLEQALIRTAADLGVAAERAPGRTGVWVGRDKLAAIGVRLSTGWITSHGFALNVSGDLAGFDAIVPCGLSDFGVTSLERLLGAAPDLARVASFAARHIADALGFELAGEVAGPPLSW
jgi:lipoyl(octanoyl) transferase